MRVIHALAVLLVVLSLAWGFVQPVTEVQSHASLLSTAVSAQQLSLVPGQRQGPPVGSLDYPANPTADIPWTGDLTDMADVQAAFNNARTEENNQLGTTLPPLSLPSQAEWDAMSDGEKALWLINRERTDRGVQPLQGLETNVTGVAQSYAQFLLDNNAFAHDADGLDPWQRLQNNPAIGACYDFLEIAENLYVLVTTSTSIPLPVEQAVYTWMYDDGNCCNWGHRQAILWFPYDDNNGPAGQEGFLGLGRANGGPYEYINQSWNYAELIVMNVFDPCSTWDPGPGPIVYAISGRVIDQSNSQGIGGVTVSTGTAGNAVTNDTGNYALAGLAAGTYTFSLSKPGYAFNPPSFAVTVSQDRTDQDFLVEVISLNFRTYLPLLIK